MNGLNQKYIPDGTLRIETHITTDKQAYLEGETLFFSVLFLHSFNKTPVFPNVLNLRAFDVMYDLYDPFSNLIGSGEYDEYYSASGPSVGFSL